jgi:hypothetical protein
LKVGLADFVDTDHELIVVGWEFDGRGGLGRDDVDVPILLLIHRGDEEEDEEKEDAVDERAHGDFGVRGVSGAKAHGWLAGG